MAAVDAGQACNRPAAIIKLFPGRPTERSAVSFNVIIAEENNRKLLTNIRGQ